MRLSKLEALPWWTWKSSEQSRKKVTKLTQRKADLYQKSRAGGLCGSKRGAFKSTLRKRGFPAIRSLVRRGGAKAAHVAHSRCRWHDALDRCRSRSPLSREKQRSRSGAERPAQNALKLAQRRPQERREKLQGALVRHVVRLGPNGLHRTAFA